MWSRLSDNRNFLGWLFMLPAAAFLLLFLVYPLGLGIWLSFTDARIGRPGKFVGLENYLWIIGDSKFQTAVFFTIFYTVAASVVKFGHRPVPGHPAQREAAVQGDPARARADPVHRADGAVGDRVLVDLRPAVLGHLVVAARRWG